MGAGRARFRMGAGRFCPRFARRWEDAAGGGGGRVIRKTVLEIQGRGGSIRFWVWGAYEQ